MKDLDRLHVAALKLIEIDQKHLEAMIDPRSSVGSRAYIFKSLREREIRFLEIAEDFDEKIFLVQIYQKIYALRAFYALGEVEICEALNVSGGLDDLRSRPKAQIPENNSGIVL